MRLSITRRGFWLTIAPEDGSPLPLVISRPLTQFLIFVRKQFVHASQRDPGALPFSLVREEMYSMSPQGHLICMAGFLPRVRTTLEAAGHTVTYQDLNPPRKRPTAYEINWERVAQMEFRAGQEACFLAVAGSEGGVIDAAAGFGKTFEIALLAQAYDRARIVVVVKGTAIGNAIYSAIRKVTPNVGRIKGGVCDPNRVTVCSADSLHKCPTDIDFLLLDECDELVADTYADGLARLITAANPRCLGFSASLYDRKDNKHARIEGICGPLLFTMAQQEAEAAGNVVPIEVHWHACRLDPNPADGKTGVPKLRWGIWRNKARNQIIADVARSYDDDTQFLIIVGTTEHAMYLRKLLPDYTLVHGKLSSADHAFYVKQGLIPPTYVSPTPKTRERWKVEFASGKLKKVIATHMWARGVSFDSLANMFRADGGSSVRADKQISGRVSRVHAESGKTHGKVHDIMDQFDRGFRRDALSREKTYAAQGWKQVQPQLGVRLARGGPA